MLVLLVSASEVRILSMLADANRKHDKGLLRVYSVEILLMMDSGLLRNT